VDGARYDDAMSHITTRVATSALWDDVQAALTGGGDGRACQCAWPVMTSTNYQALTPEQRQERLHAELAQSDPAPGLVAYVDGKPAGWVRVGPWSVHQRMLNSRAARQSPTSHGDRTAWVISCFSVRREYRRQGVMAALLAAAVEYARSQGARTLEAVPVDPAAAPTTANALYVGALPVFLAAGFTAVATPTKARRLVMRVL